MKLSNFSHVWEGLRGGGCRSTTTTPNKVEGFDVQAATGSLVGEAEPRE